MCAHFSRACVPIYIFRGTCFHALNYFVTTYAHFLRAFVPTTTHDIGTVIYSADVNSDENYYSNISGVISQDLLVGRKNSKY